MAFPLIPIAIALLMAGCAAKKCPDSWDECLDPEDPERRPPPEPGPGERLYTDGNNRLLVENEIEEETAESILDYIGEGTQKILDFFQIDSPFRGNLNAYFVRQGSERDMCDEERMRILGCAGTLMGGFGNFEIVFNTTSEFIEANQAAILYGRIYEEDAMLHEMSHALRIPIASPWIALEEGLAGYTDYHLVTRLNPDNNGVAQTLVHNTPISEGAEVELSDRQHVLSMKLVIERITDSSVFVRINSDDDRADGAEGTLPRGVYNHLDLGGLSRNAVLRVSGASDGEPRLTVYRRSCAAEPYELDGEVKFSYDCDDIVLERNMRLIFDGERFDNGYSFDGWYESAYTMMTEDGRIPVGQRVEELNPYPELRNDIINIADEVPDYEWWKYYLNGLAFWSVLRQRYGHEAVVSIIQAMSGFSRECASCPQPYGFFAAFMDATGMGEEDARAYFEHFSIPTDDEMHGIGGICWDAK